MNSRSFVVDSRMALNRAVDAIQSTGWQKPFVVTISDDASGPPTARQYRVFHAILGDVAEQAAIKGQRYPVAAWREHYKALLIGIEEIPLLGGGTIGRPLSTKTLSRTRFEDFLEQIRSDAATEYGVVFPERGE